MPRLFGVCVVAVLCHVSGVYALAASDRSHLSSDPRVKHARALVERGRFDEALAALRILAPDHPDQTDVRFLIGLAGIGAATRPDTNDEQRTLLLAEAIQSLHAILINRPDLVRVRLELARAFFLKGEDTLSREHFERVLAGKPPPAMAANIRRFLSVIRARRRWSAYLGLSIAPDTNVNAVSDAEYIYINGLPFRRSSRARASSGIGVVGWGGGEYQYPLSDRFRLRVGADLIHTDYAGTRFDRTFALMHLGPRFLVDRDTEVSLLAAGRRRWLAGSAWSYDVGSRVEVEHRLSRRLTAHGRASWYQRRYRRRNASLDGPLFAGSLGGSYLLTPTVRGDLFVGAWRERPQSKVWRNASFWSRLGTSIALPWGFTVGSSVELRWVKYEGRWAPFTLDGAPRKDRVLIARASVLNRALTTFGFSPQLVLVYEAGESNAQGFEYRRNRAELRVVRQF